MDLLRGIKFRKQMVLIIIIIIIIIYFINNNNFINKFSYKLKFTEYDLLVIKVIIIIIIKKTYLQFISTK